MPGFSSLLNAAPSIAHREKHPRVTQILQEHHQERWELPLRPQSGLGRSELMSHSSFWLLPLMSYKPTCFGRNREGWRPIHSLLNGKRLLVVSVREVQAFCAWKHHVGFFTSDRNLFLFSFLTCVAGMCEHSLFGFLKLLRLLKF